MITLPANTRIWIAAGVTDLRRGFTGLSALVQTKLEQSPLTIGQLLTRLDQAINKAVVEDLYTDEINSPPHIPQNLQVCTSFLRGHLE